MTYKIVHTGHIAAPLAGLANGQESSILVPSPANFSIKQGERLCVDTGIVFDWPTSVYGEVRLSKHVRAIHEGVVICRDEEVEGEISSRNPLLAACRFTLNLCLLFSSQESPASSCR